MLFWFACYTCCYSCKALALCCTHHGFYFIAMLILVSASARTIEKKRGYTNGISMRSNSTNHDSIDTFSINSRAQCWLKCAAECQTRDQCTSWNRENKIWSLFSSNCSNAQNSTTFFMLRQNVSKEITASIISYRLAMGPILSRHSWYLHLCIHTITS